MKLLGKNILASPEYQVAKIALLIKVLLFIFAICAFEVLQNKSLTGFQGWLKIFQRWDSPHYITIAKDGYSDSSAYAYLFAFFPGFPWLVRLTATVIRDFHHSALLVSTIASIFLSVLFYRLARIDFSEKIALCAVFFLFIFPTSYFLHIGYTESLFLCFVIGSFYLSRTDRWVFAVVLGIFAAFTRVSGIILIPALMVEAFQQYRATKQWKNEWLTIPLISLGFAGYLIINFNNSGDWFYFVSVQHNKFSKHFASPISGISQLIQGYQWRSIRECHMVVTQELIFIFLGLITTIWGIFRLRWSYSIWSALNLLLFVSTSFILSTPRYLLALFPIFILFAELSKNLVLRLLITSWSILFLGYFISQFVQGMWAF